MFASKATKKLKQLEQEHLIPHIEKLTPLEKGAIEKEILAISTDQFTVQQSLLKSKEKEDQETISPFLDYRIAGSASLQKKGQEILKEGKVGCLILSGGQGTRLGFPKPKGMFPISPIKKKTLFQIFAEKCLAAGKHSCQKLPLAIMTSPKTDEEVQSYFRENSYFGLDKEQISFFQQDELPLLNEEKKLFLERVDKLATGPDGNGAALHHFVESGIWKKWFDQGVRNLILIPIDNPLADPFNVELVGFHAESGNEVTLQCIARHDPAEKVGVIVAKGEKKRVAVVEYSEIPKEEQHAALESGQLKFPCANIGIFCFSMEWVKKVGGEKPPKLPLHIAHKAARYLDRSGITRMSRRAIAWKFEHFIFDLLDRAEKVGVMMSPREECYAALKTKTGPTGVKGVQKMMVHHDQHQYAKVTGVRPPKGAFELSQQFHYPTSELLKRWKGRELPSKAYISESIS